MDIELYKRIKELRIKYGYKSKQAFADALNTSLNNVKGWENEKKPVLPGLDNLLAMCELFDCDLDYLTGRIEETKHDIHFVHEYTGLSEKALKKVCPPKTNPTASTLNHLIEAEGFRDFINAYMGFLVAADRLKKSEMPDVVQYPVDQEGNTIIDGTTPEGATSVLHPDKMTLGLSDGTRFCMWKLSQALMRLCEPDFQGAYKECRKNSKRKDDGRNE